MPLPANTLTSLALDLNSGLPTVDRFQRLLTTVQSVLQCDASALLRYQGDHFEPLATLGLAPDVPGRRFRLSEHPRLEIIARAGDVVRFPADTDLPDPYDGLIPDHQGRLKVHACVGLPLQAEGRLIGALTVDSFNPVQFETFDDDALRTLSAMAAVALQNALLIDQLANPAAREEKPLPFDPYLASTPDDMVGRSPQMDRLRNEIEVVSGSGLNVLILGETGTGKELVARAIHRRSDRADRELVYLNCAALPESVAESELFGHVRGAFTGAVNTRRGKFELADGGTLFLDEIGDLPLTLQAKLLRALQYGDVQRIGDERALTVDVRIIAATNKNLKQEVRAGRFREDLFHRLSVLPIEMPPLRERTGDVSVLTGYFLERLRGRLRLAGLRIGPDALHRLQHHDWPGNVRELEHCLNRAAVFARAASDDTRVVIESRHLQDLGDASAPVVEDSTTGALARTARLPLHDALDAFQRDYIEQVHREQSGNWAATARALGVDAGNLHRRAIRLGLK